MTVGELRDRIAQLPADTEVVVVVPSVGVLVDEFTVGTVDEADHTLRIQLGERL